MRYVVFDIHGIGRSTPESEGQRLVIATVKGKESK